jgi:hypothetical protein
MADHNASIVQVLPSTSQVLTGEIFNPDDRTSSIDQTLLTPIQVVIGTFGPGISTATVNQTLSAITQLVRAIGNAVPDADVVIATESITEWGTVTEPLITDTAEASDTAIDTVTEVITDTAEASDSSTHHTIATDFASDSVEASDDSPPLWIDLSVDTVLASDQITHVSTDLSIDTAEASDSVIPFVITDSISDTVIASDDSPALWLDAITDTALASDAVIGESRIVFELINDVVIATDGVISFAGAVDRILDIVIALDDAQSAPSVLIDSITDTATALDYSYAADPNSLAWVLNTETGAPWFFTNYQFNSIIEHAGMLLAGAQDGLYYLQGDDDAGSEIESELITGMLDFDFSNKKHVPYIYFGYTGGELECDVETFDRPIGVYTYGMDEYDAEAPRNNRIKLGKGLNSRYWRFTIRNLAGMAFQVYDKFADVVASKRRL